MFLWCVTALHCVLCTANQGVFSGLQDGLAGAFWGWLCNEVAVCLGAACSQLVKRHLQWIMAVAVVRCVPHACPSEQRRKLSHLAGTQSSDLMSG